MPNKKIKSEDFENNSNVEQDEQTKKKSNAQKAMPWFIVAIIAGTWPAFTNFNAC